MHELIAGIYAVVCCRVFPFITEKCHNFVSPELFFPKVDLGGFLYVCSTHGPLSENINIGCAQILSRFYRYPANYLFTFVGRVNIRAVQYRHFTVTVYSNRRQP